MVEKIAPFISYDDWKELGPLNRRAPDGEYDGFQQDVPTTPYWPHINVGGRNKMLGNPEHDYKADAFSNAHGQLFHFMNVLDKGDREALRLVREAAKAGDKVTEWAEKTSGHPNAWSAVGPNAETAMVARRFVETALEFYPASKGVRGQELPKTPEQVDFAAFGQKFAEKVMQPEARNAPRLKRFRSRVIGQNGAVQFDRGGQPPKGARRYSGVVAVVSDAKMEKDAVNWMKGQSDKLIFAPSKNSSLWSAIIDDKSFTHQRKKLYDEKAKGSRALESLCANADAVAVVWNGDPMSKGGEAIATAARSGKLAKVIDGEGRELPVYSAAREAMSAHMSRQEAGRAKTLEIFDMDVARPEARFALSLIRSEGEGTISDRDINRIAMMGSTINDVAQIAKTPQGAKSLVAEEKLSTTTVRLLADDQARARGAQSYTRSSGHLRDHKVEVIGPENYPESLLRSGDFPPFLFISGSKEAFREAQGVVGVIGEAPHKSQSERLSGKPSDADLLVASRSAPAVASLASSKAMIARLEGETPVETPVNAPQVLILDGGHGQGASREALRDRKAVLEADGVVISRQPPEELGSYWDRTAGEKDAKGKPKGDVIGIPSTGTDNSRRQAGALLGNLSESVVVLSLDAGRNRTPTHEAITSGLRADRRPVVVNFNDVEGIQAVSGNRALLLNRGVKALERGGFGTSVVESMGQRLEGSRPAIDSGPDLPKAMRNVAALARKEPMDLPDEKSARRTAEAER